MGSITACDWSRERFTMDPGFSFGQQSLPVQFRDNFFSGFKTVETLIFRRATLVYFSVQCENIERDKPVPLSNLIVIEIMRWRYFDASGSKQRIDVRVGNYWNTPFAYGKSHMAPDQMLVSLVVGMHGYSHVTEHCFRTRGGDNECVWSGALRVPFFFLKPVKNVPEKSFLLGRDHLQI